MKYLSIDINTKKVLHIGLIHAEDTITPTLPLIEVTDEEADIIIDALNNGNEESIVNQYGLSEFKSRKILEIKDLAFQKLSDTDWKVIKYRDQIDASLEPDMSETEYLALLDERQNIRTQSNTYETQINAVTTKEELDAITITF